MPRQRFDEIGRLLIASRIASGKSQKQLAQLTGVSEACVSRDERNEYRNVTVARAQRIFDALKVEVSASVDNFQVPDPVRAGHAEERGSLELISSGS